MNGRYVIEQNTNYAYKVRYVDNPTFDKVKRPSTVLFFDRNLMDKVRHGDKLALAEDLRDIFRTGERAYTRDMVWSRWQSMIYTTNWIERLQKDFRRVTKMRGAMPDDESVLTLMGKTAMDKNGYGRQLTRIDYDKTLFPD